MSDLTTTTAQASLRQAFFPKLLVWIVLADVYAAVMATDDLGDGPFEYSAFRAHVLHLWRAPIAAVRRDGRAVTVSR